ncbi:hypothetical protein ABPG72_019852 [Tetrahymena utriculariae]
MGNDISSGDGDSGSNNISSKIQKDFTFVREKKDPRFGDIQIYKEKGTDKYVFLKGHWCGDEENYNQFLRQCNRRIKINHPNVLKMIGFNQHSETQICGDFSKINCYYEYYSLNLEKELEKRYPEQKYFSEPEIWYLIDSMVNACSFFESNKIYHGDIRPTNVLLTVSGQVKLADNGIVNQSKNGYNKALFDGDAPYLSPLLINALANKEKRPSHNHFKSDVYSLGMTMLECCTLFKALNFYDYSSCEIRFNLIEDSLQKVRLMYSGFLVNLIREMLNREEFQRPTFHEISAILTPYRQQIQSLTPFSADYITVKQNYVHPDQNLILQSGVNINPSIVYNLNQANTQGINLLNQSLSVVQTASPAMSTVKYSPDKSHLAHSKLVFQQSNAPTNFTSAAQTPIMQPSQNYQQVATPSAYSPNQSTVKYQMNGNIQQQQLQPPLQQIIQQQQFPQQQMNQQSLYIQQQLQQAQIQQQQQQLPLLQQQSSSQHQQSQQQNQQFVVMAPSNTSQFNQNPQLNSANTFGISSQIAVQMKQPLQNQVGLSQQPQQQIQQFPQNQIQQQQQQNNFNVTNIATENSPHNNQQNNIQVNGTLTPSNNQNNSSLTYSPINLIYQNPQSVSEKPFQSVSFNNINQPIQQQNFAPVQQFQLSGFNNNNNISQTGSFENPQNNSSANSAQFTQYQNATPQDIQISQQQAQSQGYINSNVPNAQQTIQQAINYSNSVLQRNPNF